MCMKCGCGKKAGQKGYGKGSGNKITVPRNPNKSPNKIIMPRNPNKSTNRVPMSRRGK